MIRRATIEDVPAMIDGAGRIARLSEFQKVTIDPETVARVAAGLTEQPNTIALVAERDRQLVGVIGLHLYAHLMSGALHAAQVCWWVDLDHRDGLGIQLLEAGEQWARDRGVEQLQMIAPTARYAPLFERRGYRAVGHVFELELR